MMIVNVKRNLLLLFLIALSQNSFAQGDTNEPGKAGTPVSFPYLSLPVSLQRQACTFLPSNDMGALTSTCTELNHDFSTGKIGGEFLRSESRFAVTLVDGSHRFLEEFISDEQVKFISVKNLETLAIENPINFTKLIMKLAPTNDPYDHIESSVSYSERLKQFYGGVAQLSDLIHMIPSGNAPAEKLASIFYLFLVWDQVEHEVDWQSQRLIEKQAMDRAEEEARSKAGGFFSDYLWNVVIKRAWMQSIETRYEQIMGRAWSTFYWQVVPHSGKNIRLQIISQLNHAVDFEFLSSHNKLFDSKLFDGIRKNVTENIKKFPLASIFSPNIYGVLKPAVEHTLMLYQVYSLGMILSGDFIETRSKIAEQISDQLTTEQIISLLERLVLPANLPDGSLYLNSQLQILNTVISR